MEKPVGTARRLLVMDPSDEQGATLIDLAFSRGTGNLQAATLRRVMNHAEHADATVRFRCWVWAVGRMLPGLIRRRGEGAELNAYGS